MKSWKTTVAGISLILVAVGNAGLAVANGQFPDWEAVMAALAGIGLMAARDNNVTSEEAGAKL